MNETEILPSVLLSVLDEEALTIMYAHLQEAQSSIGDI